MKTFALLAMAIAAASCSSAPQHELAPEQRYAKESWARVPASQARSECQAEINRPGGTPSLYLCMKEKGYTER